MYHFGDKEFYEEELTKEAKVIEEGKYAALEGFKFAYDQSKVNMMNVQKYFSTFDDLTFDKGNYTSDGEVVCKASNGVFYTKTEIDGEEAEVIEEGVIGDFVSGAASIANKAKNMFKDQGGIKAMDAVKNIAKKAFKQGANDINLKTLLSVASKTTADPVALGSLLFGKDGAKALLENSDITALGFVLGGLTDGVEIKSKKQAQLAVLYYIVQNHIMDDSVAKKAYTVLKKDFSSGETYQKIVDAFDQATKKGAGEAIIQAGETSGETPWIDEDGKFIDLDDTAIAKLSPADEAAYNAAVVADLKSTK